MSADPAALLAAIPLEKVLGPVVIAICLNTFVYGFSVLQFLQYRARLFRDTLPVQLLVTWTFAIDTVHSVALCWMLWTYMISNFTNVAYLFSAPWPFTAVPAFLIAVSAPVQMYFTHRIWEYSRSRLLYVSILALIVANIAMGLVATTLAFTHANVQDFKDLLPIVDTWLALTAVCDGVISGVLIFYLARHRVGFRRHEPLKNRIVNAFIESSILTAIVALADLMIYSIVPNTNYHIILSFPIGRIYTCNLLAMLNARLKQREDEADGVIPKQSHSERRLNFTNLGHLKSQNGVQVSVSAQEEADTIVEDTPSFNTKLSGVHTRESVRSAERVDRKHREYDMA